MSQPVTLLYERLRVALLHQNTESVIEAAAACDKTLEAARIERAVLRKDLLERDALFLALSRERVRPARDCILDRMPSMRRLVETILACLRGERANLTPPRDQAGHARGRPGASRPKKR